MSRADIIVAAARSWIGTPYQHQAALKGAGADCLGLVRGVWQEVLGDAPVDLPAYSEDWNEARGSEHLWTAAARILAPAHSQAEGQVLLFRMRDGGIAKHLGITATRDGAPSFIHAYSGHGVVENALTAPWRKRVVARFAFPTQGD
ncbi:NlpC/P60 family protein [Nereida sp. MMG025]|uniref:NlpC/P60 family protein n=1 Tax=Nereida sp. MMG025 TaxID=2909981 RepID=UPI001F435467|nr:NlpC/P60 family protein [Nereida sp. MMG025]MCF6443480.1 NlpC/P60 family protein [Nereida sp. MMG025]